MTDHRIEIITIGDELVEGRLVDTNAATMSDHLLLGGLTAAAHHSVADDLDDIGRALVDCADRSRAVLVSGGLGPTSDDLTAAAAARAFGLDLERREEALEHTRSFFTRRGREMPPTNAKQADLPAGAELLDNPWGTAMGFALTVDDCRLSFMPGVPRELEGIFTTSVLPRLRADFVPQQVTVATLKLFGLGESDAAHRLDDLAADLMKPDRLLVQYRATFPELHLRLVLTEGLPGEIDGLVAIARERLGPAVFAAGDGRLAVGHADIVLSALAERGLSIAVADAGSAGHLARRVGTADGGTLGGLYQAPSTAGLTAMLGIETSGDGERDAATAASVVRRLAGTDLGAACLAENLDGGEGLRVWVSSAGTDDQRTRSRDLPFDRPRCRKLAAWIAMDNVLRHLG